MPQIKHLANPELPSDPYLPFLSAVEQGLIDPHNLTPEQLDKPLGVLLANGKIPHQSAGLVVIGGKLEVCDHAGLKDISKKGDELFLAPSSKSDVTQHGEIRDSGLLVLTRPSGLLKVIGVANDLEQSNYWPQPDKNNKNNIKVDLFGLKAIVLEPVDIDNDGVIRAHKII